MALKNTLTELHRLGQSPWLDNLRRSMVTSGTLKRLIDKGLRGMTSNPTIFEKAIAGSADYDEAIKRLVEQGRSAEAILDALVIEDIQMAADAFRPLYEQSGGADGFVSIEVNPRLAHDIAATVGDVRRIWRAVNRPNIMVKIPGTREGLPAIRDMLAEGYNINITLLFAVQRYEQVIEAHLTALEQRLHEGQPIDRIASVASFFVSRVDTLVDQRLEAKRQQSADVAAQRRLDPLMGQAAVANAKLAYAQLQSAIRQPRWTALQAKGATIQRVLWGSTSTKNPRYNDLKYVEELIGAHTVNTMPDATLEACLDHGRPAETVTQDLEGARRLVRELADLGIDLRQVTQELEEAGVKAFVDSYETLLRSLDGKRRQFLEAVPGSHTKGR